jgi:hypothetical protein
LGPLFYMSANFLAKIAKKSQYEMKFAVMK